MQFGSIETAIDYFEQVREINPSHAPTSAFLDRYATVSEDDEDDMDDGETSDSSGGDDDVKQLDA